MNSLRWGYLLDQMSKLRFRRVTGVPRATDTEGSGVALSVTPPDSVPIHWHGAQEVPVTPPLHPQKGGSLLASPRCWRRG